MAAMRGAEALHPLVETPIQTLQSGSLSGRRAEAWRQGLVNLTLVGSDLVLAFLVWEVACLIQIWWAPGYLSGVAIAGIVPVALAWVGLRASQGLYPGYGLVQAEELRRQTYALLMAVSFAAVFALAFQVGDAISRLLLLVVFTGLLVLAPLTRWFVKGWMRKHGVWGKPVVVLGSEGPGLRVEHLLNEEWALGYRPVAVFEADFGTGSAAVREGDEGAPGEGALEEAAELSRKHRVDTVFLALPHASREYLAVLANLAGVHFRSVVIIPDLAGVTSSTVIARDIGGTLGVEVRHSLLDPAVRRAKRTLDVVATLCGGLLVLPLLLLLAGLVWVESRGGSVFYKDKRMGRDGRLFSCIKFRTMVPDAEAVLARMLGENPEAREEYARYHKLRNDPRVTRIGRVLRKTSLDELPQLWNVLRGEMSLVGPRPYLPRESGEIGLTQREILRVYPGITGPWQVGGRSGTSFGDRVQMDGHYVRNWSIWLDLVILARTMRCVMSRSGAC